jgi:hypothetical protein
MASITYNAKVGIEQGGSRAFVKDAGLLSFGDSDDVTVGWDGTDLDVLALADDSVLKIGNGTACFDLWLYGNIPTSYLLWDASADLLRAVGPVRNDMNTLGRRFNLKWVAGQRGKPSINADIQNAAEATRMIADPDFEILGSNASSDDVTFNAEGGIKIETDGGGTDSVIILPHLDANQSAWTQVTWGTDQETEWECHIKTGSAITAQVIWAGLKLTNTSVTATDNDQAFFRYAPATNSGKWQAVYSIGGTDTEGDAGVTVAADTEYHLKIAIDSSRLARFYINGALVSTSTALTTATDLINYVGILESAAAAKHFYIYGQTISRKFA